MFWFYSGRILLASAYYKILICGSQKFIDNQFQKKKSLLLHETSREYLRILIFGQKHQAILYNVLGL